MKKLSLVIVLFQIILFFLSSCYVKKEVQTFVPFVVTEPNKLIDLTWRLYENHYCSDFELKKTMTTHDWRRYLKRTQYEKNWNGTLCDSLLDIEIEEVNCYEPLLVELAPFKGKYRFLENPMTFAEGSYGANLVKIYEISHDTLKILDVKDNDPFVKQSFTGLSWLSGFVGKIYANGEVAICSGDYRYSSFPYYEKLIRMDKKGRYHTRVTFLCSNGLSYDLLKKSFKKSPCSKVKWKDKNMALEAYIKSSKSNYPYSNHNFIQSYKLKDDKRLYLTYIDGECRDDDEYLHISICDTLNGKCKFIGRINKMSEDSVFTLPNKNTLYPDIFVKKSYEKDKIEAYQFIRNRYIKQK